MAAIIDTIPRCTCVWTFGPVRCCPWIQLAERSSEARDARRTAASRARPRRHCAGGNPTRAPREVLGRIQPREDLHDLRGAHLTGRGRERGRISFERRPAPRHTALPRPLLRGLGAGADESLASVNDSPPTLSPSSPVPAWSVLLRE